MAPDLELRQVDRHHLRHGADAVPLCRRGDRRQVPDPGPRRRRARAQPAGARRRQQRCGRVCAYAALSSTPTRTRRSASAAVCRSASTPATSCRGGTSAAAPRSSMPRSRSSTCTASRPASPGRRWAPGSRRRSTRSTISRACASASARWAGRSWPGRRGAAVSRPRRRLRGARERHHRCRRVHLPARRREARAACKVAKYNHYPVLVGKRRHGAPGRQPRQVERAAEILSGRRSRAPATPPTCGCSPSTMRSIRRRSSGWSPPARC